MYCVQALCILRNVLYFSISPLVVEFELIKNVNSIGVGKKHSENSNQLTGLCEVSYYQ